MRKVEISDRGKTLVGRIPGLESKRMVRRPERLLSIARPLVCASALLLLATEHSVPVQAQQTMVTLPSHRINDGFFERIGVGTE